MEQFTALIHRQLCKYSEGDAKMENKGKQVAQERIPGIF